MQLKIFYRGMPARQFQICLYATHIEMPFGQKNPGKCKRSSTGQVGGLPVLGEAIMAPNLHLQWLQLKTFILVQNMWISDAQRQVPVTRGFPSSHMEI